ncbi:hypothetical protein SAMN04488065_2765 [Haloplanus vescus]|uniref:Uncharacterized protein n=1 Tax=Haloplanus vescus TaxID=555874 RepID=A0A1H4AGF3_9EURY|nr:hypothetical protein [Haloplanus vescus]SEA35045.1 hypothetical protein SAMN04488065_2765 [Haloplanus vescus]
MGLRCLLGHEYANREVEREREERGNEVVVTYRTVETCDRCGERRVVSENKEVRPVRNPEDETVTTGLGGSVTPDPDEATADEPSTPDAPESGAADRTPETTATPDEPAASGSTPDESTASEPTADEPTTDDPDGGIILDDDGEEDTLGDRGRGEWPGAEEEEAEEEPDDSTDAVDDGATVVTGEGWPDHDGEDEGFDAEPNDGETMDVEFGGGLTPEERAETTEEAASEEDESATTAATGSAAGKQFVAAEGVERVDADEGETEFFCPNCDYARVAGGSSMRAGDICPDCHKGYIAERER